MINNLFSSITWLEKGLDAAWLKNQVTANNIANAETEGFKSSSVEFESIFKSALAGETFSGKKTRSGHMTFSDASVDLSSAVVVNQDTSMALDGNNVDLDFENAELAKNTIYYNTMVQQISAELRRLNIAINGE